MNKNSFSDVERLNEVAQRIRQHGVDLTASYADWMNVTMACASLGEQAREAYHTICSLYPGYQREECDQKFDNCLRTGRGFVTLGTLMKMASDAGVDTRMPRGRRQLSARQKQERQEAEENRMLQLREALQGMAQWRFNTWRQRPEVKENRQEGQQSEGGQPDGDGRQGEWRPVQDRDLDTYYCRLRELGLNVRQQDVRAMIFSRDFCPDYDAFSEWLMGLPAWNPDTDPDYLHDFYVGHLEFGDPENEAFYDRMLHKWHVGLVALVLGRTAENPQMPILKGQQHIGKTYFARHVLPPLLRDYRLEVGPAERLDKDFIISLSETPFILFDEISFGSSQKSEAFKYIVTSSRSNVRDAYARFRETRQRRASLMATTNDDNFIRDAEGNRRYLVVDLVGTVDLNAFPLPYEGAYAQALYLLDHGFNPKPTHEESQLITEHNRHYLQPCDCEEALLTFLRQPNGQEPAIALSAGDIMHELNYQGFHGRSYNSAEIGRTMKRLEFESKMSRGVRKYLVVKVDPDAHYREGKEDVAAFVPDVF